MTQSVPDMEEKPTPQETPGPHLCVLEHTRMREIVASSGIAVDVSSNQNHGVRLGKAVTPDTSGHTPNKLQRFLKEHLKLLGVAQIMISVKFIVYGIIGISVLHYATPNTSFFSFQIGFPIWAALPFIISGSMTVVSAKKQTKALLRGNLRANTVSTVVSTIGILILSHNLVKITFMSCDMEDLCLGVTSVVTGLVVILMILNCLQFLITLALSMLTYNMDGKRIDWLRSQRTTSGGIALASSLCGFSFPVEVAALMPSFVSRIIAVSALSFLKSASESPYQGLLHQPSFYQNLERKDTLLYYNT